MKFDVKRARRLRLLYSVMWWLALPAVLLRLWWRGRKEPGYRQHVPERLGFYPRAGHDQAIPKFLWVHAVSVGETRAAEPLITAMLDAYPDYSILLTHMTATGRATGQTLFGYTSRVVQSYLPYDAGWMIERFLRHFAPHVCVLIETEVWPNLVAQCERYKVPVALVNARLSERSLRRGRKFATLMAEAAHGVSCIGAQTDDDAVRLRQLGADQIQVTGNIKFDIAPPDFMLHVGADMRQQIGNRPILLCASTRQGEEELILDALVQSNICVNLLVIIVPRHPQRFDEVANMVMARGLPLWRRSALDGKQLPSEIKVLLGDTMGEMFAYYTACDVAFIGGSLLPLGGQNLIEACAVGKPVLVGPYTFNFAAVTEQACIVGAALRVADATDMFNIFMRLLRVDKELMTMSQQAKSFAQRHRGATMRTMRLLTSLMNQGVQ